MCVHPFRFRRVFNVTSNMLLKLYEVNSDVDKLLNTTKNISRCVNPIWMEPIEVVPCCSGGRNRGATGAETRACMQAGGDRGA